MADSRFPCWMEYDDRHSTVTMRHAKTGVIMMTLKLEAGATGTHERLVPTEDADNHWLAVKPADSVVFEDRLFGRSKLVVDKIDFRLEK